MAWMHITPLDRDDAVCVHEFSFSYVNAGAAASADAALSSHFSFIFNGCRTRFESVNISFVYSPPIAQSQSY